MHSVRVIRGRRRWTLGAAAALALAALPLSCGNDSPSGLSSERAAALRSELDAVEGRVDKGDCTTAAQQAGNFRQRVADLPTRVDRDLRDALEGSAVRLESLVSQQCKPATVEQPQTQTETTPQDEQNQQDSGKKDKKAKKPKKDKGDQQPPDTGGTTGATGTTGSTGTTGATGFDGGATPPGGG